MDVSATFDGKSVRILDVDVNGHQIYVTYVDNTSNLYVTNKHYSTSAGELAYTLATSATVN